MPSVMPAEFKAVSIDYLAVLPMFLVVAGALVGVLVEAFAPRAKRHAIQVWLTTGVLVAALDFRLPPDAGYPASVADIHYGIRWLKARARELKGRADRVGAIGISSGGHQAMLVAMRPTDGRYAAQAG